MLGNGFGGNLESAPKSSLKRIYLRLVGFGGMPETRNRLLEHFESFNGGRLSLAVLYADWISHLKGPIMVPVWDNIGIGDIIILNGSLIIIL